jgi:hypothetical protein
MVNSKGGSTGRGRGRGRGRGQSKASSPTVAAAPNDTKSKGPSSSPPQIRWKDTDNKHWTEQVIAIVSENEKFRISLFSGDSLKEAADENRPVKKNELTSISVLNSICKLIFEKDPTPIGDSYRKSATRFGPSLRNYLNASVPLC